MGLCILLYLYTFYLNSLDLVQQSIYFSLANTLNSSNVSIYVSIFIFRKTVIQFQDLSNKTNQVVHTDILLNLVYFSSDSLLENDKTDVVRMIKDHDIATFEFLAKDHDDDKDITCTSKYVGNPNEKNKRVCR